MIRHVQFLQFAVMIHSFMAVYTYANEGSAPSYCIFCDESYTFLGIKLGTPEADAGPIDSFFSKMVLKSALPCAIVGTMMLMSYVVSFIIFTMNSDTFKAFIKCGVEAEELDEDDAYHNELSSMKRRGLELNYHIDEVPGYEFLKKKHAHDDVGLDTILGDAMGHTKSDAARKTNAMGPTRSISDNAPGAGNTHKSVMLQSLGLGNVEISKPDKSNDLPKSSLAQRAKSKAKARPKNGAKGKGRGRGEKKAKVVKKAESEPAAAAKDPHHDDHLDLHNIDIKAARQRLGLLKSVAHDHHALENLDRADDHGLSKGKGKGKGKSKVSTAASAPPAQIGAGQDDDLDDDIV